MNISHLLSLILKLPSHIAISSLLILGFELKMEKLEALMKDQSTPENSLDAFADKSSKEIILQERYFN